MSTAPTDKKPSAAVSRRSALKLGALKLGTMGLAAPTVLTTLGTAVAHAETEMLDTRMPSVYRGKLGGFEITTLLDGLIIAPDLYPTFGQNAEEAPVRQLLQDNFLPPKQSAFYFTPVVVNTGKELVLFDTGNGGDTGRRPKAGLLEGRLVAAGFAPEDITVVVLTHMHPDHIGGLLEEGQATFPNARYVTAAAEYDFWSPAERASGPTERVGKLVQSHVVPFAEKMSFVNDGDGVVGGITAVDTSGHTPGHMAYMIESDGKSFMLFADATNHYVASLQRPDWHVRFDMDKEKAVASRKKLLGMLADMKIPATGYHMPFPAVGYVERAAGSYRWVPASYQLFAD
ncbi:MAG: MBL fold metallo-hydrolase [Pseudomonadota bacterium]